MQIMFYEKFPKFNLKIVLTNNLIVGVDFLTKDTRLTNEIDKSNSLAKMVKLQLDQYIINPKFEFDLPISVVGSMFQQSVWQVMQSIKAGSTLSYGQVAKMINSSPRAVGNACGKNKVVLFIPCHRIIAANGQIGGFMRTKSGYNLTIKKWLLEHERNVD